MVQTILNGLALGLIASPSCPSNAEEIRVGTRRGFGGAAMVALGAVTGDAAILGVVLLGLQPLLEAHPVLDAALWLFGAAVLGYIALGIFRDVHRTGGIAHAPMEASQPGPHPLRAFWAGFAITTFNPFTILWWVGLLAPAIESGGSLVPFALAVLTGTLAWFLGLAVVLHVGRRWLTTGVRRGVLVVSGLAVLAYAAYFAWRAALAMPWIV